MSHRVERFASTLRHCIADILATEVNNPVLKGIVISEVLADGDLKKARVFVSSPTADHGELVAQLTKAKGFIRRSIGKRMYLKYVPDLIFTKDITLDPGFKLHDEDSETGGG